MKRKCTRIVGEIKYVKELKPSHIEKTIKKYHWPFCPDKYELVIPKHTSVSRKTRKLANEKKVHIRRVRDFI
jgi:hypothetical protein